MPSSSAIALHNRTVATWLFACAAAVFLLVIVGGMTRLTQSGLSIVSWDVVQGIVPPLHSKDWKELFAGYQNSPEYRMINHGMDLNGFKQIFWLEYVHRLLGRFIGLLFLMPLLFFAAKRYINISSFMRFGAIFALGGLQGLMGWYMVKSGLVDVPHVSQYRLAAHLTLAGILFACLWVAGLNYYRRYRQQLGLLSVAGEQMPTRRLKRIWYLAIIAILMLFVQLVAGAFMAGLDAGLIYNSFPLIEGRWMPSNIWWLEPWYRNLGENLAMVHFVHRNLAIVLLVLVMNLVWQLRAVMTAPSVWQRHGWRLSTVLSSIIGVQFILGVATLVLHVPLLLAILHQAAAFLLLAALLYTAHFLHTSINFARAEDTRVENAAAVSLHYS